MYSPHGSSKETLASGAPLPDGDFVELTQEELEDEHNARLIEEGRLLEPSKEGENTVNQQAQADEEPDRLQQRQVKSSSRESDNAG